VDGVYWRLGHGGEGPGGPEGGAWGGTPTVRGNATWGAAIAIASRIYHTTRATLPRSIRDQLQRVSVLEAFVVELTLHIWDVNSCSYGPSRRLGLSRKWPPSIPSYSLHPSIRMLAHQNG